MLQLCKEGFELQISCCLGGWLIAKPLMPLAFWREQGQKQIETQVTCSEVWCHLCAVQAETLMSELMGSLQQTASFTAVKKQLKTTLEGEALETPAPKHVQEQVRATVELYNPLCLTVLLYDCTSLWFHMQVIQKGRYPFCVSGC